MRPLRMPTSERYQGFPEPSMTCAPEMTTSNASDCPKPDGIANKISPSVKNARRTILLPPQDQCDLFDRVEFIASVEGIRKRRAATPCGRSHSWQRIAANT